MDRRRGATLTAGPVALAVLACLAAAGCGAAPAKPVEPVVEVQAASVERKTIQDVISADAVLYAQHETTIVPKISAPIEKFYVNRGSRVRAGQLLAVLENNDLAAAVEEAKGAYEQAQASYASSTKENLPQQIESAELNVQATRQAEQAQRLIYESRLKLFRSGAIARNLVNESHVAYIQTRNQYEMALARLKGLEAIGRGAALRSAAGQLAAAKGRYQSALANLHYSEIRSPITGVVTDRPLYEGQMATAGTPMMTVMDLADVIGRAYISPQQAALLKVGDGASIEPGSGLAAVPAKVTVVSPALDPGSTTVQVWVEAANPGDRLKPGETVRVNIVARTIPKALVVPSAAILTADDGTTSVMAIGPQNHAHQKTVQTGVRSSGEVQIVSGLREGERVVTTGAYGLPDGTKVVVTSVTKRAAGPGE